MAMSMILESPATRYEHDLFQNLAYFVTPNSNAGDTRVSTTLDAFQRIPTDEASPVYPPSSFIFRNELDPVSCRSFPLRVPFFWKSPKSAPIRPPFTVEVTRSIKQEVDSSLPPPNCHGKIQRRFKLNTRSTTSLSSISGHGRLFENATLRSEVRGAFTPSLPPEVWLQIFRFAADDRRSHYSSSHSFLTHIPSHAYLPERLLRYNTLLKWKASLTTVCWFFNGIAEEILYEDIWIGGVRDGRKLAERLGGASDLTNGVVTVCDAREEKLEDRKKTWWTRLAGKKAHKAREQVPKMPAQHLPIGPRQSQIFIRNASKLNPGRLIRRLHVETPAMDKCSPHDLLLILQHCPLLLVFEDCKSIRRPIHPLVITGSEVIPFGFNVHPADDESAVTPILTTDALAHTILSRPLKRLTWTNYAHDGENFERGVRLYTDVIGPLLEQVGQDLQVLEVINCSEGLGMGAREARRSWVVAGNGAEAGKRNWSNSRSSGFPAAAAALSLQNLGFGVNGGRLADLGLIAESVTTRRFVSLDLCGSSQKSTSWNSSTSPSDGFSSPPLTLPCLSSLKVTLDNATFFVLSSWTMPALCNLAIISADARYGADGFRRFFEVHGDKIKQLELGHSSGEVEEFWITEQPQNSQKNRAHIRLDAWCPNLKEFICSADAEWNWETPDWIAPHVLLPSHPELEFIGVRGLESRLVGDADEWVRRRRSGHVSNEEEDPYFMLLQQFGSMLRKEAFPSLRFVRDMSWNSDVIRRSGRLQVSSGDSLSVSSSPKGPAPLKRLFSSAKSASERRRPKVQDRHVLQFWVAVLERCEQQGVLLEDDRGNIVY